MVTIFRLIIAVLMATQASLLYAWGANGHVLICRLAYQHLTPQTKQWLNLSLGRVKGSPMARDLDSACIWLDQQRSLKHSYLRSLHYISLPYGDASFYRELQQANAVMAIITSKQKIRYGGLRPAEQRKNLKILLHVIADLHQPLHAINYYSKSYPRGDQGGNLIKIDNTYYHGNLHHFWDQAGGWLTDFHWQDEQALQAKFQAIHLSNCSMYSPSLNPETWASDSFNLAAKFAYFPPREGLKFAVYQQQVQAQSQRQIQKAACHLALLLNQIRHDQDER